MNLQPLSVFLNSKERNSWIDIHPFNIYIRKSKRYWCDSYYSVLDISSISVIDSKYYGKGHFTKLIFAIEGFKPLNGIYIENVLEPRFASFFERIGYIKERSSNPVPCFYKIL